MRSLAEGTMNDATLMNPTLVKGKPSAPEVFSTQSRSSAKITEDDSKLSATLTKKLPFLGLKQSELLEADWAEKHGGGFLII